MPGLEDLLEVLRLDLPEREGLFGRGEPEDGPQMSPRRSLPERTERSATGQPPIPRWYCLGADLGRPWRVGRSLLHREQRTD